MSKVEERLYPEGLCEDCFWRYECQYAVENPYEYVRRCWDDGGLSYMPENELRDREDE